MLGDCQEDGGGEGGGGGIRPWVTAQIQAQSQALIPVSLDA